MKSIYLFSPYWRNFGGGERYMLYLASALSKLPDTEVIILNEFPEITKEQLSGFFNIDLARVGLREIKNHSSALRELVADADFFIPQSNFKRVKAGPRVYIQVLQVPYGPITTFSVAGNLLAGKFREAAKDIFRLNLISNAKRNSRLTLSNSRFVHDTLLRNFGLSTELLYAPVQDLLTGGTPKRKMILSVGRFFRGSYNNKRYDVLTATFRKISESIKDWEYHIVGSVSTDKKSQAYLNELKDANKGYPVFFHVNVSHESLRRFYNEATIYWHGAGYGVDEVKHPEATEHFGMSVLEAMTARCIPVVVDRGGLKETVTHEKNGFLWHTADELAGYTLRIADMSPQDLSKLQENARLRYSDFSVASFEKRVEEIFLPLLPG